jgi:hypothetical protein
MRVALVALLVAACGGSGSAVRTDATIAQTTMDRFLGCFRKEPCQADQVFHGRGLQLWESYAKLMESGGSPGKFAVVATASTRFREAWREAVEFLADKGYDRAGMLPLGDGKAIVSAAPGVQLALVEATVDVNGKEAAQYGIVVLWKVDAAWKVVYFVDTAQHLVSFLIDNKPAG